jgi:ubiquinone/menaquinone biosynthesis C-methylase UbiE
MAGGAAHDTGLEAIVSMALLSIAAAVLTMCVLLLNGLWRRRRRASESWEAAMTTEQKAYRGVPMEGLIARWYARTTAPDRRRYARVARRVMERVRVGARILDLAAGPGSLAVELASSGCHSVAGLDISRSFVSIAQSNARGAGVVVDFRLGNASKMPFADSTFDYVVCMSAFKNFTEPVAVLDEIYRVLAPAGAAAILDLRREASIGDIETEVRQMNLSPFNASLTRWIFRFLLLKNAYTRDAMTNLVAESRFGRCEICDDGIGFEVRLEKEACAKATSGDGGTLTRPSQGIGACPHWHGSRAISNW